MVRPKNNLLMQKSPAYRAYKALRELPPSAPIFELDDEGNPIVEMHEVFCRVRGTKGRVCGEKLSQRGNLLAHMQGVHNAAARAGGCKTTHRYRSAQKFYISIMEDMDYPGKRTFQEEMTAIGPFRFGESKHSDDDSFFQDTDTSVSTSEYNAANSSLSHSVRRRRTFLLPDRDNSESEGEGEVVNALPYSHDEEGEADDDSTIQDPAAHISKRIKLIEAEPKVKVEHEIIVIEDDIDVVHDQPASARGTHRIKNEHGLIEGTVDHENKKQVVLTTNRSDGNIGAEALVGANVASGEAIEQEDVRRGLAAEEDDMGDMEIELEMSQIKQAKLQARLEELQLKQKIAGMKKRKAGN